jgi:ABC-type nitrate/sulfonate/bicarbonate transport system substrate-binding protein
MTKRSTLTPSTRLAALVAVAGSLFAGSAWAQQKVDFVLNWVPGGDHAPYYCQWPVLPAPVL